MKKYTIQISKGNICTIILIIIGLILFLTGVHEISSENNALDLQELTLDNCKQGQYVKGTIESFAGKYVPTLGNDIFYGISHTWLSSGMTEYDIYTVKLSDGSYISALLESNDILNALETYQQGRGAGAYFTGKIVSLPVEINWNWMKDILVDGTSTDISNRVLEQYALLEIDGVKAKNRAVSGITLFIVGVILFFVFGGHQETISSVDIHPVLPDNSDFIKKDYHIKLDIYEEEQNLLILSERFQHMKKSCLFRLPLFIIGILIFKNSVLWELKFAAILMLGFYIKSFVAFVINSNFKIAMKIAKIFHIKSISYEIGTCKIRISRMKERLDMWDNRKIKNKISDKKPV